MTGDIEMIKALLAFFQFMEAVMFSPTKSPQRHGTVCESCSIQCEERSLWKAHFEEGVVKTGDADHVRP